MATFNVNDNPAVLGPFANAFASLGGGGGGNNPASNNTPTTTTGTESGDDLTQVPEGTPLQVTPGKPTATNQMNVTDYGGNIVGDPSQFFTHDNPDTPDTNESMLLSDHVQGIDENAEGTNIAQQTGQDVSGANADVTTAEASTAQQVDPREAIGYDAEKTQDTIAQDGQATAAQGEVSEGAQINADDVTLDTDAIGRGETETGKALDDFASLDLDDIDDRATLKGQLDGLQDEFTDNDGNPRIPVWAQGAARGVSKIAAFKGMTGSAATEAMASAIMEASISVAQQDAAFFQTVTLQNLNNEQASIINKANVLSKMDLANMDARMAAAVQNSKNFMEMDLANLANEQQAEIINTQARVQSILEDAKAENAARLYAADTQNEFNKFYDELNSQIDKFNTEALNNMAQFNTNEINDNAQFNAQLENNREQFYRNMQYNIDVANAKWRQTVTLTENQQQFEAASTDVKNMVGVSVEQLNQLWDRSDSLLDYLWKSTENELDRKQRLIEIDKKGEYEAQLADAQGKGSMWGSIVGAGASAVFDWIF